MYSEDLYTLDLGNVAEYSATDLDSQLKLVNQHRQLFQEFLAGKKTFEDVSDCISDYGLDPDDYWEIVENNISQAIINNSSIEDAQWFLQKIKELENS